MFEAETTQFPNPESKKKLSSWTTDWFMVGHKETHSPNHEGFFKFHENPWM